MSKKINSRDKGARGELEWARFLLDRGINARRGQQFAGGPDSPDVVCPSLPGIHFEVKRVEHLSLYKAMEQASRDAGRGVAPVVAHRRNGEEWLVIMRATNWIDLIHATGHRIVKDEPTLEDMLS